MKAQLTQSYYHTDLHEIVPTNVENIFENSYWEGVIGLLVGLFVPRLRLDSAARRRLLLCLCNRNCVAAWPLCIMHFRNSARITQKHQHIGISMVLLILFIGTCVWRISSNQPKILIVSHAFIIHNKLLAIISSPLFIQEHEEVTYS